MKIALFGGAFNPPHLGHMMIAQQVLDFTDTEEVWFLPNFGQVPPKPDVAPVEDRLAMTQMITMPHAKVSTIEIDRKLSGSTYTLLPHLPSEYQFVFVVGADQLPVFHLWGNWQELLKKLPFLVFPRYGYPTEPLYEHMTLVHNENLIVTDISSTKIRERVRQGLAIDPFVPPGVASYIQDHNLYVSA